MVAGVRRRGGKNALSLHRRRADPLGGTWASIKAGDHENRNPSPSVATIFLLLLLVSSFILDRGIAWGLRSCTELLIILFHSIT